MSVSRVAAELPVRSWQVTRVAFGRSELGLDRGLVRAERSAGFDPVRQVSACRTRPGDLRITVATSGARLFGAVPERATGRSRAHHFGGACLCRTIPDGKPQEGRHVGPRGLVCPARRRGLERAPGSGIRSELRHRPGSPERKRSKDRDPEERSRCSGRSNPEEVVPAGSRSRGNTVASVNPWRGADRRAVSLRPTNPGRGRVSRDGGMRAFVIPEPPAAECDNRDVGAGIKSSRGPRSVDPTSMASRVSGTRRLSYPVRTMSARPCCSPPHCPPVEP